MSPAWLRSVFVTALLLLLATYTGCRFCPLKTCPHLCLSSYRTTFSLCHVSESLIVWQRLAQCARRSLSRLAQYARRTLSRLAQCARRTLSRLAQCARPTIATCQMYKTNPIATCPVCNNTVLFACSIKTSMPLCWQTCPISSSSSSWSRTFWPVSCDAIPSYPILVRLSLCVFIETTSCIFITFACPRSFQCLCCLWTCLCLPWKLSCCYSCPYWNNAFFSTRSWFRSSSAEDGSKIVACCLFYVI